MKANLQSESLVAVRIDNFSNKSIAILLSVFFAALGAAAIGGMPHIAPNVFWEADVGTEMVCDSFDCNPTYNGFITGMMKLHQSLMLEFEMNKPCIDAVCLGDDNRNPVIHDGLCEKNRSHIDYHHLNHTEFVCGMRTFEGYMQFDLEFIVSAWADKDGEKGKNIVRNETRTRQVTCNRESLTCDSVIIFVESYLDYPAYHMEVEFYHPWYGTIKIASQNVGIGVLSCLYDPECYEFLLEESKKHDFVATISGTFKLKYVNKGFTMYEFGWKYGLLIMSTIVLCAFSWKLKKVQPKYRSYEQKWIGALLFLLLFFDDPFFVAEVYDSSPFWSGLYCVTMTLFLAALLLFWLCILDIVRSKAYWSEQERKLGWLFYLPKVVLCALIWCLVVSVYIWIRLQNYNDPTYADPTDFEHHKKVKAAAIGFFCIYTVYAVVLACIAVYVCISSGETPKKPFLFLFCMSFFMLFVCCIGTIFGGFTPRPVYTEEFTIFFTSLNFYMWLMAFAYYPVEGSADGTAAGSASKAGSKLEMRGSLTSSDSAAERVAAARPVGNAFADDDDSVIKNPQQIDIDI